ncbi:hypothetical protein [Cerasicoccus maritimus]|uniref:hypothetical protein n=1 Tax=Cerasicoccus maritimus TaxID=490089 RepID=UPI002852668D|nr:hypothetical protein [Cerasicoccus maritimus]
MTHLLTRTLALSGLLLAANTHAATYLIDFNTAQSGSYPDASTWNVYAATGDVTGTLTDTTGASSSITIAGSGDFLTSSGSGMYNSGVGAPSWTDATAPAGDFFWTGNTIGSELSYTVSFSGLTAGSEISLDVFASRSSSLLLLANYEYSLDGGTSWLGFDVLDINGDAVTTDGWDTNTTATQLYDNDADGYTLGRYMNISGITLTETTLDVRLTKPADVSNYAGINSMQLTVIPEPSTYIIPLFIFGVALLMVRRKG